MAPNYWEDFFSLDKIIYPLGACVLMGVLYFVLAYALNTPFNETILYACAALGFLAGNVLKTHRLAQQRQRAKTREKQERALRKKNNSST